ncbi:enoyl-CoA hydratase/isomerase family protein [Bryobacter aggregatus]|uniref:enoyl-CoA hydratase/isomerase family protein n=1 Tax=Bryobacter aggregatus TaxID=360054 RepID=UPI000B2D47E7|nr:enoyl-CoA hydratase/isomerase family protein [Bryobacter aggregatus]
MTPLVEIERLGRVLAITLNRPDKRNALNREMSEAIVEAVEAAESDSGIGAILLAAQGAVFCAGMDLAEAVSPEANELTAIHARLFTLGARLTKPIVCAVRGPAIAGGLGLVANAHVVVAAHGSTFGLTEIRIGMWPYTVYRAVEAALGARRTLELTLSSKIFNTPEALAWGLVHEVLPSFELDDRALTIASTLSEASTETIQRGLRFTNASRGLSDAQAMELALQMRSENFGSLDFEEGVKAFREKRAPRWPSRS